MDKTTLNKGIRILNETAKLVVSEDCMTVRVYPEDGFEVSMLQEIAEVLQKVGIHSAAILPAAEQGNDHWVVARGTRPVNGEDSRIEILKHGPGLQTTSPQDSEENSQTHMEKNSPAADRIDPRELNIIVNARRGDRVARKIPPGRGIPGRDVFGREILPVPGKWTALRPGKGVESIENDTYLVATVSGKVHIEDEVISVFDEWELDGSVDISTGHIDFWGKLLTIKGSVCGGFRVWVRGDLVVEGNVEDDAAVHTRGNLVVNGLIRARNTILKAGGSLRCQAVEYAKISAGRDVVVEDYLLDVTCKAGGDVSITSGKGLVAGGRVLLGGSFACGISGTAANVPTMIHAGFNPQIKETYDSYVQELEEYAGKRLELQGALEKIEILERKQGKLSAKTEALKNRIISGLATLKKAASEKQKNVEELETQLGRLRSATIKIHQKAYPNSIIRIANASLVLKKEVEAVQFRFRQGQVVLSTI